MFREIGRTIEDFKALKELVLGELKEIEDETDSSMYEYKKSLAGTYVHLARLVPDRCSSASIKKVLVNWCC
jgi:hypothetical protein